MSVEHGFESPTWMARALISQAHPTLVRKAAMDLIEHLASPQTQLGSAFEMIDRLVQVSTVGKYTPPEDKIHVTVFSGEDEETIQDLLKDLDDLPGVEDDEA